MPNARLEIDDSIIKRQLQIVPDNTDDDAGFPPLWTDQPKELSTLFPDDDKTIRAETIKPQPGICIKTKNTLEGKEDKVFMNICTSEVIPQPEDISDQELISILDSENPSDFKIPMSLGQGHEEKDKSGGSCMAYDVVIHPVFFKKMVDNPLFHNFFVIATMEGMEEKYNLLLDHNGWTVLKNKKYHGTMPEQTVRTKMPLVQELSSVKKWTPENIPSDHTSKNPLIEEMDPISDAISSSSLISEISTKSLISEISTKSIDSPKKQSLQSNKKNPKYVLEYVTKIRNGNPVCSIEVQVNLSDTCTGNKINVKLSENELIIETNEYFLSGTLPYKIDLKNASGYFVTSTKDLLMSLPVMM